MDVFRYKFWVEEEHSRQAPLRVPLSLLANFFSIFFLSLWLRENGSRKCTKINDASCATHAVYKAMIIKFI